MLILWLLSCRSPLCSLEINPLLYIVFANTFFKLLGFHSVVSFDVNVNVIFISVYVFGIISRESVTFPML